jgi:alpha-L-fucosidase 2
MMTMVCMGMVNLALLSAAEPPAIPYDAEAGRWLFDEEAIVSRNDVVYTTPSVEPWEAMPTGGGDLSAMVRCDGESLHLHLTKSDAWGFQAPADAPPGTRYFNNVSPGHVELRLGDRGKDLAAKSFRQRLDLYEGKVVVELGGGNSSVRIEVWGHPTRKVLVVEITDPESSLDAQRIELSEWRESMEVGADGKIVYARELHTRPAAPHMASAGMEDYFDADSDPLLGRGTAVALTSSVEADTGAAQDQVATLTLPAECPTRYHILIATAVTTEGDPLADAKRVLDDATQIPIDQLKSEHVAWWRDYWQRSFLRLESADKSAQWLTAAYHVHLYTLGCVNRGSVPAKWDGGAGLMRGDERTWGLAEWIQEVRFTYLPLYAANRLDMARGLTRHYSDMVPYLTEQTRKMWGVDGLWIPETVLPWGGIEDWVLNEDADGCMPSYATWDVGQAPYGRFDRYNRYVGFLMTAGPELCWHYLAYHEYSGDSEFLDREAYPVIRGVCEFLSNLLRQGEDGKYHLDPANALETWWMVRDPADTMDAVRWLYPEFIRLAEQRGQDAVLRQICAMQLAALPEPSIGLWHPDGTVDSTIDAYAPAAAVGEPAKSCNFENPALYRVFPFGLSGIGSDDHARAATTFKHRIFSGSQGWAMDAIWAARLGLRGEACSLLTAHAKRWNRFRYGGWDSGNSSVFPDNLSVVPYTDAGGVACFALNEILLQSYDGVIRLVPAVADDWSGVFRLRAERGFLVSADFVGTEVRLAEVTSLHGNECVIANPWPGTCLVHSDGDTILRTNDRIVRFVTDAGNRYTLEPDERPLTIYSPAAFDDSPNDSEGMPGRDH